MIDYRRPFSAMRRDPKWKRKIVLGALISLIPYLGMIWLLGWQMQYQRSVAWGDDSRLPKWSDFETQVTLGFKSMIAALPYSALMIMLIVPFVMLASFSGVAMIESDSTGYLVRFLLMEGALVLIVTAASLLLVPPVASTTLRVALYGTLSSGFEFSEIWRRMREYRRELFAAWGYTLANAALMLIAMVVYFGGIALLFILSASSDANLMISMFLALGGMLVYPVLLMTLSLYLGVANSHYFGQFGRIAYQLDAVEMSRGPA